VHIALQQRVSSQNKPGLEPGRSDIPSSYPKKVNQIEAQYYGAFSGDLFRGTGFSLCALGILFHPVQVKQCNYSHKQH
jgi:hypothetical protein